jgi:hypothetical protein
MGIKQTITTIFLVPIIHIPEFKTLKNVHNFINGYIKDEIRDIDYGENSIFLLFRPTDVDKFREFLDGEYERTKSVIDDYNHPGGYVVIVYKLDDKWHRDYQSIRRGEYSRTSPEFQAEFPKLIILGKRGEEFSLQYRIFTKTEDLRKFWEEKFDVELDEGQELWEGFSEENETLNNQKLIEYEK